jgi:hypothetical protein
MVERFDLDKFRARTPSRLTVPQNPAQPARRRAEPFLKGPVPLVWLAKATKLGGSSLAVGICLWFQCGVLGGPGPIKVTKAVRRKLGLSADRLQRGLKKLEQEGLIAFDQRGRGHCPVVRLVEAPRTVVEPHAAPPDAPEVHPGGV